MRSFGAALFGVLLAASSPQGQARPDQAAESTFYAVSYVEAMAPSTRAAVAAFDQYRRASQASDGCIRIEIFEQIGRPGHYALIETWRDQKAFDARDAALQKQLLSALGPIRASGYDERPYNVLSTAPSAGTTDRQVIFVISHVDVAPNPQVPILLTRQAEASRKEAGNLRFDVVQHTMRANHFTVIEAWRDQRALDTHAAAAHTRQYRDELQPFTGSPLDERVFTAVH
jgi:quinol monooxygenase YgiN